MIESSTQKGFKPNDSCVNQLISIANSIFMHLSLILDDDGDDDDDDDDDDFFFVGWDYCQRSSLSRISDTPRAAFEPAQNLSSGLVE